MPKAPKVGRDLVHLVDNMEVHRLEVRELVPFMRLTHASSKNIRQNVLQVFRYIEIYTHIYLVNRGLYGRNKIFNQTQHVNELSLNIQHTCYTNRVPR